MVFEPIVLTSDEQQKQEQEARNLVAQLLEQSQNKKKSNYVRRIDNFITGTEIPIISWRFNEWDYYSKKVELPTKARGLFTTEDGTIICRGYNKFFNLNEMSSVKEDVLSSNTKGPYTVTVKSNGCIVFISGLEDGKLVVCSKHSTGVRDDLSRNHAIVAQNALESQLISNGSSSEELAKMLYKYKITAVCEYCDDDFEEHVLEYKDNKAGLYLHGLNLNTVRFKTYPMNQVNEFGKIFGFKETKYVQFQSFDETLQFMRECNKTGTFEGEEIEGFVVRCFQSIENGDQFIDYFFKFKFEEPYLLYRELREVTKQFITQGATNLKFGKHKLICMDYMKFVMPYLVSDEKLKHDYLDNKGIIELRKKYFQSKNTTSMQMISNELDMIDLEDEMKKLKFGSTKSNRYVLVTVATIGCGKTTTSVGLSYLYPDLIDHIQNDNIQSPGKDKLVTAALEVLERKPIVIMDKNNHKTVERKQIFDGFERLNETIPRSKLKFICLNFIQDSPRKDQKLWNLTRDRVINRGDSHQSIKVEKDGVGNAEKIMRGFISRFQPVNENTQPDSNFDLVINLDVHQENSSLKNMKTIVNRLQRYIKDLELNTPTEDEYLKAFEKAKAYKPTFTKKMTPTKRKPNYFAINVSDNEKLVNLIEPFNIDFFNRLKETNRVQKYFHITLIHSIMRKNSDTNRKHWEFYNKTFKPDISNYSDTKTEIPESCRCPLSADYTADIELKKIVWDTKVMCIEVSILGFFYKGSAIELPFVNGYAHITIGTIDKNFPPVLAGKMLKKLYGNNMKDKINIQAIDLPEHELLSGLPLYVFMN